VINVGKLEEQFPEKTTINLTEEGYDKLLGGGSVSKAFTITVKQASEAAIEKIKENGGEVTIAE
jgi:large subunit ribosomal protein L15